MAGTPPPRNSVPALDGVRGFAFLLVLLAHFSNHYGGPFQGVGKVGVWIFFALSAFLLTRRLLVNGGNLSRPLLANYAFRRFMRIVPLYYLTLLIYLPFGYVIDQTNFFSHITFMEGAGHLWTIAAELQFYFVLPLLVVLWGVIAHRSITLALIILCLLWAGSVVMFPSGAFPVSSHLVLPYLNVFLAGMIAAVLARNQLPRPPLIWSTLAAISLTAILAATPSVWSLFAGPTESGAFYRSQAIFGVVAAALILAVTQAPNAWAGRIFGTHLLRKLGQISFSGYLIHPLILRLTSGLSHYIGTVPAVIVSGIATYASAWLLFTFIEARLMQLHLGRNGKLSLKAITP